MESVWVFPADTMDVEEFSVSTLDNFKGLEGSQEDSDGVRLF